MGCPLASTALENWILLSGSADWRSLEKKPGILQKMLVICHSSWSKAAIMHQQLLFFWRKAKLLLLVMPKRCYDFFCLAFCLGAPVIFPHSWPVGCVLQRQGSSNGQAWRGPAAVEMKPLQPTPTTLKDTTRLFVTVTVQKMGLPSKLAAGWG